LKIKELYQYQIGKLMFKHSKKTPSTLSFFLIHRHINNP